MYKRILVEKPFVEDNRVRFSQVWGRLNSTSHICDGVVGINEQLLHDASLAFRIKDQDVTSRPRWKMLPHLAKSVFYYPPDLLLWRVNIIRCCDSIECAESTNIQCDGCVVVVCGELRDNSKQRTITLSSAVAKGVVHW